MSNVLLIENRRSVRDFCDKTIPDTILRSILNAGLYAPSPKNRQPWEFVVLTSETEKIKFISDIEIEIKKLQKQKSDREDIKSALETLKPMKECSVIILVCYKNDTTTYHEDNVDWNISAKDIEALELMSLGASVENILLKAEEMGVASLWCGDVLYAYPCLKKYSNYPVVSAVCLGYADNIAKRTSRKNFDDVFLIV